MQIHELKLAPEPFGEMQSGRKTIECRLFDGKRQQINIGDELVFTNRENSQQQLRTQVIGLLRYDTFSDLLSVTDVSKFGGRTVEDFSALIRQFYSEDQEHEYGVLGIHVRLV